MDVTIRSGRFTWEDGCPFCATEYPGDPCRHPNAIIGATCREPRERPPEGCPLRAGDTIITLPENAK